MLNKDRLIRGAALWSLNRFEAGAGKVQSKLGHRSGAFSAGMLQSKARIL